MVTYIVCIPALHAKSWEALLKKHFKASGSNSPLLWKLESSVSNQYSALYKRQYQHFEFRSETFYTWFLVKMLKKIEFSNIAKKLKIDLGNLSLAGEDRFRESSKISIFFKIKIRKIHTNKKNHRIAFYVSIPNFRTLGSIIKNFEILVECPCRADFE